MKSLFGRTVVMGDVHADWRTFNAWINKKGPGVVLQCGDFGWWPKMTPHVERGRHVNPNYPYRRPMPKVGQGRVYFCDGNHEDHISLIEHGPGEVCPGVFWMPRGSVLPLPDGRNVLFMGGATSIDRHRRKINENVKDYGWFPQEVLQDHSARELSENLRVDIVISHTCPQEFPLFGDGLRDSDPSRIVLSYVLQKFRPSLWFFGHWHIRMSDYCSRFGCRWFALDAFNVNAAEGQSWMILPA